MLKLYLTSAISILAFLIPFFIVPDQQIKLSKSNVAIENVMLNKNWVVQNIENGSIIITAAE